jgi:hypothetical protein
MGSPSYVWSVVDRNVVMRRMTVVKRSHKLTVERNQIKMLLYNPHYTGRFIMFSVITNIHNKKTKGPTLIELFTATGKLNNYLTTREVRCVHHRWHGTHRYVIQILATHASTWVHQYSSLLQWSVPLGQRGHVAMVDIKVGPLVFSLWMFAIT